MKFNQLIGESYTSELTTVFNYILVAPDDVICVPKDSDKCLQETPNNEWVGYTCETSKEYCDSWSKDMRRCCPKTCENTDPFTSEACNNAGTSGVCVYPNKAQCLSKGIRLRTYNNK